MKRFLTLITIAALSLQFVMAMQGCSANEQSIRGREFRGGWIHIVGNTQIKDMTRQQVQDMYPGGISKTFEQIRNILQDLFRRNILHGQAPSFNVFPILTQIKSGCNCFLRDASMSG